MRLFLAALVVGAILIGPPKVATAMYSSSGPDAPAMTARSNPGPVVTALPMDAHSRTAVTPVADGASDGFLGDGVYVLIGYVSGLAVAAASYYAYRAWMRRHHGAHLA